MQQINQGNPVSLNMVNEYTRLYTKDQLQLVPQERVWGLTEQAEIINGRVAMSAITIGLAFTLDPTLKALAAAYRAAKTVTSAVVEAIPTDGLDAAVSDAVSAVGDAVSAVGDAVSSGGGGM